MKLKALVVSWVLIVLAACQSAPSRSHRLSSDVNSKVAARNQSQFKASFRPHAQKRELTNKILDQIYLGQLTHDDFYASVQWSIKNQSLVVAQERASAFLVRYPLSPWQPNVLLGLARENLKKNRASEALRFSNALIDSYPLSFAVPEAWWIKHEAARLLNLTELAATAAANLVEHFRATPFGRRMIRSPHLNLTISQAHKRARTL